MTIQPIQLIDPLHLRIAEVLLTAYRELPCEHIREGFLLACKALVGDRAQELFDRCTKGSHTVAHNLPLPTDAREG